MMGQMRVSSREDYRNHSFLVFGGIDNDKIDNKTTQLVIIDKNMSYTC